MSPINLSCAKDEYYDGYLKMCYPCLDICEKDPTKIFCCRNCPEGPFRGPADYGNSTLGFEWMQGFVGGLSVYYADEFCSLKSSLNPLAIKPIDDEFGQPTQPASLSIVTDRQLHINVPYIAVATIILTIILCSLLLVLYGIVSCLIRRRCKATENDETTTSTELKVNERNPLVSNKKEDFRSILSNCSCTHSNLTPTNSPDNSLTFNGLNKHDSCNCNSYIELPSTLIGRRSNNGCIYCKGNDSINCSKVDIKDESEHCRCCNHTPHKDTKARCEGKLLNQDTLHREDNYFQQPGKVPTETGDSGKLSEQQLQQL